jgi:hypothetical protein
LVDVVVTAVDKLSQREDIIRVSIKIGEIFKKNGAIC